MATRNLKVVKQSDVNKNPASVSNLLVDRDAFLDALEKVKQVVKAKAILPILNNVWIEFAESLITLKATDLELTVVVTIPGSFAVTDPRTFLLPGSLLRDALAKMKEGDVVISFSENNIVTITQDTYDISFPEIKCDDYPEIVLDAGDQFLTIEGKQLSRAIEKVIYAVSKDETRYALTGVALMISAEEFFAVGTDAFRVSVYKTPAEGASDFPATIVPKRAAKLVADLLDIDGFVQVLFVKNDKDDKIAMTFDAPNIMISTRIINQVYPDWTGLISFNSPELGNLCTVSTSYITECLERVGIVSGKEAVKMNITSGRINFEVESGLAKARSWIPATVNIDNAEFNVYAGQFADAFGHIGTDRADMTIPEAYGLIRIAEKPEQDGPPRHIQGIMPVRK